MHPRNLHLYFFSPTGGTQHVAGLFAENLNAADACTDITVRAEAKTFSADDCLLVFFPVYGGRVPGPCLERVRALRGTDTPAVLVAVFGNRAVDDALLEMRDTLAPLGFRVIAAAEVIAPHSVNTDIAAGRPDASDRAKIAEFCTQLKSRIAADAPEAICFRGSALLSGLGVVRRIQPREEGIIRTAVELFEREQHAHADIELARLVFGVGRAVNVAAAALQLGAQLLL